VTKLLIVDDSALMRRLLGDVFKAEGDFEVTFARDGVEALACLETFRPDVITLDVQMPHMDGLACLDRIMVMHPCPVVMVSSLTERGAEVTLDALQLGAVDFVAKPGGAISLAMDQFGPILVDTVRAASKARLRLASRLTERVRLRAKGGTAPKPAQRYIGTRAKPSLIAATPLTSAGPLDGVVLVGSSTGGPPALDALLSPMPADFPWPILIAQHMPASFTGPLARRLDRLCALTVLEVTGPTPLVPGQVYIGRGDADMIVSTRPEGVIVTAAPSSADYRWHPSVDRLVLTAMEHLAPRRLIGVLMTGMGNDGAAAMTRLSAAGGRTIAESEETAVVWGMPGELVKAGGAQVIAPLGKIADRLLDWAP
jgi:two-component system, chemotaxis family, protein-glutamate methylesterase/glutaminase